jgi:uncharacterized protein with PIN domain
MSKIYVDTNIFIDIYQASTDPVGIVDLVSPYAGYLVLPDQTVREFNRNRLRVLNTLIKQFRESVVVKPWYTSLIKELPQHKDFVTATENFRHKAREIVVALEAVRDPKVDPVAVKVASLFDDPRITHISVDADLVSKAHTRKLLGNPPTSPDKYTVGDEVIWEALLANVREDLIIVTRDKTYQQNLQYLALEYLRISGCKLSVTGTVSEALKQLGQTPPPKLVEQEAFPYTVDDDVEFCPECGGLLKYDGYEGSDGDEAFWAQCKQCGFFEMR